VRSSVLQCPIGHVKHRRRFQHGGNALSTVITSHPECRDERVGGWIL
jgi:hypothetical protein